MHKHECPMCGQVWEHDDEICSPTVGLAPWYDYAVCGECEGPGATGDATGEP